MKRWGVFALVVVAGLLVWFRSRPSAKVQQLGNTLIAPPSPDVGERLSTGVQTVDPVAQQEKSESTRTPVQAAILGGRVIDARGTGIQGATVSWVAITEVDIEWEPAWHDGDWGRLERSEQLSTSGLAGQFTFDHSPDVDARLGSILWASSPGYVAACRTLPGGHEDVVEIVLETADVIDVLVVDSSSRPVSGALVEQFGMAPVGGPREAEGKLDDTRARRQIFREARTDASGVVLLAALPGEQVLRASTEGLCSPPWRGEAQGNVILQLAEKFSVGGRVTLPDWSHLNYVGERRITIGTRLGNTRKSLATIRQVGAGPWGPVELPVIRGVSYEIRLEGSPIIPLFETFDTPIGATYREVDLIAELGHDIWIAGVDESGEIVPNTEATVWWEVDGVRHELKRRCYPESSRINPWSMPAGSVQCSISAPGYVTAFTDPIVVPQTFEGTFSYVMLRGGRIEGACLYQGEALEDFEVYLWTLGSQTETQTFCFRGRKDGRFLIEGAPVGECSISATSGSIPACEPQRVQVGLSLTSSVTLELLDGLEGEGSVVDLQSGRPIADAEVQRYVMADGTSHGEWGEPVPVRMDGTFSIDGLSLGENRIYMRAPGYAESYATAIVEKGEVADYGVVPLSPSQTLELRLLSADREEMFAEYVAYADDPRPLPATRFSSQGIAIFEGVSPGPYYVRIHRLSQSLSTIKVVLKQGEPWVITHRLSGGNRLTVEVVPAGGVDLSDVADIGISYVDSAGRIASLERPLREDGTYYTDEVDGDFVTVAARGLDYSQIAVAQGSFGEDGELFLSVILGGEPLSVRVVDTDGHPISGVQVQISDTSPSMLRLHRFTNEAGIASLLGVPARPVVISLEHPIKGLRVVPYGGGPGEEEYELRNDAGVRLLFRDGDLPLAGARAAVVDVMGNFLTNSRVSKAEGWVHWIGLTAGEYRIRAEHPQTWAVDLNVTATLAGQDVVIQMRRLGNLVIEVLTEAGLPVAGAALALESVETGTSVANWLQAGRVRSTGLATDNQGRVRIDGLPHGAYRWSVSSSGERVGQGALTVRPTEETLETIRIVE